MGQGALPCRGGGEEPGPAVTARPPTVNHSVNHSKRDRGATHKYLVGVREEWATTFTRPMVSALTLRELLALPGYKGKVVWASGDATLDCVAAIDWTSRQAFSLPVDVFRDPLRQFVFGASQGEAEASSFEPSPPEEFIVSVTELLAVVALAAARGPEWRGRLVAYAGDNQTVGVWLEKRHTHREVPCFLLQLLTILESVYGFRVYFARVRTYHNVTADALTREDPTPVMRAQGLSEVKGVDRFVLELLNRGWLKRVFLWGAQRDAGRDSALQLSAHRAAGRARPWRDNLTLRRPRCLT